MVTRIVLWGIAAIAVIAVLGFGGWLWSLPPTPAVAAPAPIAAEETAATLAALKPPKRARPLVAVIGINDATETNDYLMPTGVLRRADVADVVMVATGPGPVALYPALTVEPDMTIAAFDARYPEGADYVVVPAMSRDDDAAALAWIKAQAANGAIIVSVCAGAKVVAAAGLLDGKRATTHWYYLAKMRREYPDIIYVPNRRLVVDDGVTTTTGITAALPMMLTLIEAIAGRDKAVAVAHDLGLAEWDARHASDAFTFTRPFATTVLGNVVAFWNREKLGIPLTPGVDEVTLAIVADAWSRTYRSEAVTFADGADPVTTENGVRIVPDAARADAPSETVPLSDAPTLAALDATLAAIGDRYGPATADVVAMQLEYPRELPRN